MGPRFTPPRGTSWSPLLTLGVGSRASSQEAWKPRPPAWGCEGRRRGSWLQPHPHRCPGCLPSPRPALRVSLLLRCSACHSCLPTFGSHQVQVSGGEFSPPPRIGPHLLKFRQLSPGQRPNPECSLWGLPGLSSGEDPRMRPGLPGSHRNSHLAAGTAPPVLTPNSPHLGPARPCL